ncbi:MAG: S24 family peptidase [Rhodospirillaceae bacterium]|nr:S24 family peptidase [Rhodospirillaceae bacterium]MDE0380372.1 S24 family peptidase [Rhodospirillales bacterium]MDE0382087.1 S24 family peptidase [Rhodospirillales bacterium]
MLTSPAYGADDGTGGDPPAAAPAAGPENPATEPDPAPQDLRRPLPERGVSRDAASRLVAVPEIEFEIETDPSARMIARGGKPEVRETVRWQMPEAMIRDELRAETGNLRIVRVRGEAMEPVLRAGDRLLVDTAKRDTAAGGLFVLRGPGGFEVWRVEPLAGTDPPRLRLSCANPRYQAHACLAGKLDILGRAIWKMTRE